jgi:Rps23 Pro-64 3,4-dihydroxylase Tpa1-like proline 4-hydroxylase
MELSKWVSAKHLVTSPIVYKNAKPFAHIALKDFLRKEKFNALRAALAKENFSFKEADLFSFSQTQDLHASKNKTIKEFLKLLQSKEFTLFLSRLSGVKLKQKVDAAGFIYSPADYLLCHDDGFSSRRIAYVMNFATLGKSQGGALALFSSNSKRQPTIVSKRIQPQANTLVLFTVTSTSHHMVEEVINGQRVSIAGWFHG